MIRKPKLPKRPKATAGIGALKAHLEHIRKVEQNYKKKLAEAKKAVAAKEEEHRKVTALNKAIDKARESYKRIK